MGKKKTSPVVILVVVAAVLYGIIYILPRVTGVLRSSYTAEYGELKTFDKAEGYIVRNEYVYFSTITGTANRYIKEDKLVRRGTRIMEVTPGTGSEKPSSEDDTAAENSAEALADDTKQKNGKDTAEGDEAAGGKSESNSASDSAKSEDSTEAADSTGAAGNENSAQSTDTKSLDSSMKGTPAYSNIRDDVKGGQRIDTDNFVTQQEGILSYHADGNESALTPKNMAKKDKRFFQKMKNTSDVKLNNEVVAETDPVFKICDRAAWYIVCYIPREHESRYAEGTKVDVNINGEKTIRGTIYSITDERREKKVIIKTNHYYKKFATVRRTDIEVITSDVMGLLISNTSIVEKGGKKGVYVRQKTGKYRFVPINIIATDGTDSAISPSQFRDAEGNTVSTVRSYDDILRRPDRKAS